jgi:hypothetical protein
MVLSAFELANVDSPVAAVQIYTHGLPGIASLALRCISHTALSRAIDVE